MGCWPGFFCIASSINVDILLNWRYSSVVGWGVYVYETERGRNSFCALRLCQIRASKLDYF